MRIRPLLLSVFLARAIHAQPSPRVSVQIVTDESDAALSILARRKAAQPITDVAWRQLFTSEGYRNLKARELGMNRPFTDSAFKAFLLSDSLLARYDALKQATTSYATIDIEHDAARALAYLPAGAAIHARLYLMIKPKTNSFVWSTPDGRAIFLYVDPSVSRERAERDIVTHEMHHIGLSESCVDADAVTPRQTAQRYAGALGEGLAMLAAAGSADTDPHEFSTAGVRDRWRHDLAQWKDDLRVVDRFLLDVAEGRLTGADSIAARAAPFWGDAQGAWYTVGYMVGTTIEHARGRETLRTLMCDRATMLTVYNDIARGAGLPLWSPRLLELLGPER